MTTDYPKFDRDTLGADPLALWLHRQGIGCDMEYNDPFDMGMGRHHTGDHLADAVELRAALEAVTNVT